MSVTTSAVSSNTADFNTLLCASTSDDSVPIIPGLSSQTKIGVATSPSSVADFSVIVSSDTDIPTLAKYSVLNSGTVNSDPITANQSSGYIFNAGSVVHNLFSNSDTAEGADVSGYCFQESFVMALNVYVIKYVSNGPNIILISLQSELDERSREVDSLRTVWNESRQKLSQVV